MFDPQLNNPELFLNKDFIGVWDNVVKNDFNELVIKWINESTQICPRSNIGVKDSQVDIAAFNPQMSNHIMQAVRLCLLEYIDWYPFLKNYNYHSTTCVLQHCKFAQTCQSQRWSTACPLLRILMKPTLFSWFSRARSIELNSCTHPQAASGRPRGPRCQSAGRRYIVSGVVRVPCHV